MSYEPTEERGYYRRTTTSATEVISLSQLKRQLVWYEDDTSRDAEMNLAIDTALDMVEGYMGLSLRPHVYRYYTNRWKSKYELINGPIASVVIEYYPASDGTSLSTLDSANYKVIGQLSQVVIDGTMPSLYSERPDCVQIEFTVDPYEGDYFNRMKQVALILAAETFENPANSKDDMWKFTDRMLNSCRPLV